MRAGVRNVLGVLGTLAISVALVLVGVLSLFVMSAQFAYKKLRELGR